MHLLFQSCFLLTLGLNIYFFFPLIERYITVHVYIPKYKSKLVMNVYSVILNMQTLILYHSIWYQIRLINSKLWIVELLKNLHIFFISVCHKLLQVWEKNLLTLIGVSSHGRYTSETILIVLSNFCCSLILSLKWLYMLIGHLFFPLANNSSQ